MLKHEKVLPGLYAIHFILVKARLLVGEASEQQKLYELLDCAELLPALIARPDDTTDEFREVLTALGEKYADLVGLAVNFDRDRSWVPTYEASSAHGAVAN